MGGGSKPKPPERPRPPDCKPVKIRSINPQLIQVLGGFVNGLVPNTPVGGFGPRQTSKTTLTLAHSIGAYVGGQGREGVSGGAKGVDTAYIDGYVKGGGTKPVIFTIRPGEHPFRRTDRALNYILSSGGGVIVFLREDQWKAGRGGSYYTYNKSVKMGIPTIGAIEFEESYYFKIRTGGEVKDFMVNKWIESIIPCKGRGD